MKSYDLSEHQWSVVKSILSLLEGLIRLPEHYLVKDTVHCHSASLFFSLCDTVKPDKNDNPVLSAIKQKFTK